jgi:rhamnulokinase
MTSGSAVDVEGNMPVDSRALVAVDLGAESCRVSLLRWIGGVAQVQLVHRFVNGPVKGETGLHWPLTQIIEGVEEGLLKCVPLAPEGVRSIAVDGWAVDYVRLDGDGHALAEPFCYRDERSLRAEAELHRHISALRMREITGIEQLPLNTLYQLYSDRLSSTSEARWLNLPEYLLSRWGAEPVAEFTNATHTQLVEMNARSWSREIFHAAGLNIDLAPKIVPPGTLLGKFQGPFTQHSIFQDTELIAPACHDTASAIAGIPAVGEDWAYISSGTWSLVGTVTSLPVDGPSVRADSFSNLGGVGNRNCFHKNVNGMWLIRQCQNAWAEAGHETSIADLLHDAEREPTPEVLLDVDDADLLRVGEMPQRINRQLIAKGAQPLDESSANAPAYTALIMHSLAHRYAETLTRLQRHTGKELRRVFIVGGGSQNTFLNKLTAKATGLQVHRGSVESSTIGNFAVQLATLESDVPASSMEFADVARLWSLRLNEREGVHGVSRFSLVTRRCET